MKKKEQAEKQRLAKLEQERREREAQQSQYASSGSASSAEAVDFVMVNLDCVTGWPCEEKIISISGGPGQFAPSFSEAPSGAIQKGYNGALQGRYNYIVKLNDRTCSGSFYISGTKPNFGLSLYPECNDAASREF